MSWWDPIVDYFSGDSSAGIGDALGETASNAGTALSGLGSSALGAVQDYGASLGAPSSALSTGADYTGGMPVNTTSLAGIDAASSGAGADYSGLTGGSGIAASGGAGLMGTATDWAKKNPTLVDAGVKAGLALTKQNAPTAATTAGYNAAAAGNAAKSAVGSSLVNQAPFMANNAEAASKGAGANASSALHDRLTAQGYKPGDAMYESMMQQQNLGNRTNDATAYAAGQGQRANQEATGAGLMTPTNLGAYDSLGGQQNAQQVSQNKTAADVAGDAKTAFDIWSNPDKATKSTTYE